MDSSLWVLINDFALTPILCLITDFKLEINPYTDKVYVNISAILCLFNELKFKIKSYKDRVSLT